MYHSVFNCLLCTMVCTVYNIKPFICHVYVCVLYSPLHAVQVSCSYQPTSSGGHISKNASTLYPLDDYESEIQLSECLRILQHVHHAVTSI